MRTKTTTKAKQQLKALARVRGEERKQHFANGGDLHS